MCITNLSLSFTRLFNSDISTDHSTHGELSLLMDYINANGYKNISSFELIKDTNGVAILSFISEKQKCTTKIFKTPNQPQFYSVEVKSISCKSEVTN